MTGSDDVAALNGKLLSFLSVSYTSCLFHNPSSDSIMHCFFFLIDKISIPSADVISFHTFFFLSGNLKILTATNLKNWLAYNTFH